MLERHGSCGATWYSPQCQDMLKRSLSGGGRSPERTRQVWSLQADMLATVWCVQRKRDCHGGNH